MKYLIINGSPHRGNTWRIVELAKEYINGVDDNAEFNEIHLIELKLPFCTGCSNCFRKGHEICPHKDIITKIISDIDASDGLIVASTAFNMRETALLKNFLDHLCFMLHRPHFFKSKALVITSAGGIGEKNAAKSISSMLMGIGFNRCYIFATASNSWNDYRPDDKAKMKLSKITQRFYQDVRSKKLHSPSAALLIPYNLFRGMSLAYVKGAEYETKDGDFWTEENRKKHVYDPAVPVSLYKRPIGHLFYLVGILGGKFVKITYRK